MKLIKDISETVRIFTFWILLLGYDVAISETHSLWKIIVYALIAIFIGCDWEEKEQN